MDLISERLLESDISDSREREPWSIAVPSVSWRLNRTGVWTSVTHRELSAFGWKIHVSSTLADASAVLAIVSGIAFEVGCSFKYLSGPEAFLLLHFKNENRLQSGKFIALYPTTEELAAGLLERLHRALGEYSGLDVLTDRAYRGSSNVFYRWGAFVSTGRLNSKGEPEELVPDGSGRMVPDLRLPRFVLPEGKLDPFSSQPTASNYLAPEYLSLDQFTVESVLRFTNAGGRYRGKCKLSGVEVVIKEARPHTGFVLGESAIPRLQREVAVMKKIGTVTSDLAPAIVKHFSAQDHEYLAMEYLPGIRLSEWIARENPLYSCLHSSRESVHGYLLRASRILERIRNDLNKLHALGFAFGDLSSGNVIVDEHDNPRFIDFEACTLVDDVNLGLRTPDFCLLHQNGQLSAKERDLYAVDCIAIALVLRLTTLAEISNYVLSAVTQDLALALPEVPQWWYESCDRMTRAAQSHSSMRMPSFVPPPLDTTVSRAHLRQLIANAILECYSPNSEQIFPASSTARRGAFLSFGFGCGGILPALRLNNSEIDESIISKFAEGVDLALKGQLLPTNYDIGIVGLLDVCTQFGLGDLSERILQTMSRGWKEIEDPSLGRGLTGLALSFLRHGYSDLAKEVMVNAIQAAKDHSWEKNGMLYGRSGVIAGACQFGSLLRTEPELGSALRDLIEEEFAQTVRHPKGHSLSLRGEVGQSRLLPYLSDGTAGFLLALIFAHTNEHIDFSLSEDNVIALSADLGTPFMLEGSLMDGAAGLAVVLEVVRKNFPAISDKVPSPNWNRIQKYLLPLKSGVGVLHPGTLKFDLSHSQGSAGILEALLWVDGIAELNVSGLNLLPVLRASSAYH